MGLSREQVELIEESLKETIKQDEFIDKDKLKDYYEIFDFLDNNITKESSDNEVECTLPNLNTCVHILREVVNLVSAHYDYNQNEFKLALDKIEKELLEDNSDISEYIYSQIREVLSRNYRA